MFRHFVLKSVWVLAKTIYIMYRSKAFAVKIRYEVWHCDLLDTVLLYFQFQNKSQFPTLYFNSKSKPSSTIQHIKTMKVVFCIESGSFLVIIMSQVIFCMDHIMMLMMMEFRLTSITSTTRHSFFLLVTMRDRRKRKKTEKIDSESWCLCGNSSSSSSGKRKLKKSSMELSTLYISNPKMYLSFYWSHFCIQWWWILYDTNAR